VQQFLLADDPLAMLNQIEQQVEYSWSNRDRVGSVDEFAPIGIKPVAAKSELHWVAPEAD
jgi:hypothetical protein